VATLLTKERLRSVGFAASTNMPAPSVAWPSAMVNPSRIALEPTAIARTTGAAAHAPGPQERVAVGELGTAREPEGWISPHFWREPIAGPRNWSGTRPSRSGKTRAEWQLHTLDEPFELVGLRLPGGEDVALELRPVSCQPAGARGRTSLVASHVLVHGFRSLGAEETFDLDGDRDFDTVDRDLWVAIVSAGPR
jgi:hypothetical protein